MSDGLQIKTVQITNYQGARDITIHVYGPVIELTGENEAGKSSVLKAIEGCIRGAVGMDAVPMTTGERRSAVKIDLGKMQISRKLSITNPRRGHLNVTAEDGKRWGQHELNTIFTKNTFDPLKLARMKGAELITMLRSLAGPEFCARLAEIDEKEADAVEQRKDAKKHLTRHGEPERPVSARVEAVDTAALLHELDDVRGFNGEQANRDAEMEAHKRHLDCCIDEVQELEEKLKEARERFFSVQRGVECLTKPEPLKDTSALEEQLSNASAINAQAAAWERYDEDIQVQRELQRDVDKLEDKVADLRDKRAEHAATAKLPVVGLRWTDAGVWLGGVPWEQLSSAKTLACCVDLGMALGSPLKAMFIDNGEKLSQLNFELIHEKALAAGWQFWIATVGKGHGRDVIEIVEGKERARWEPTGQVVEIVGGKTAEAVRR